MRVYLTVKDVDFEFSLSNDDSLALTRYSRSTSAENEFSARFGRVKMQGRIRDKLLDYAMLRDTEMTKVPI